MKEILDRIIPVLESNQRQYEVDGDIIKVGMPATIWLGFNVSEPEQDFKQALDNGAYFINFTESDLEKNGLVEQQVYIRTFQISPADEKKLFGETPRRGRRRGVQEN